MRTANENHALRENNFGALSVLALVKNPRGMYATISFLNSHYKLKVVSDIPHLIKALEIHRPKVLLLSWNLKNIDVKRLREMLVDLFKIRCIVFAEDTQKQTTASLMASGIPQFLLAPVSGANIHSRIQSMFNNEALDRKQKIFLNSDSESPPVKVKKEDLPNTLTWQETRDPQDSTKSAWKAEYSDQNFVGTYLFKGKRAPQFNQIKNEWNIKESDGSVFFKKDGPENFGRVKVEEVIDQISDPEFKTLIKKLEDGILAKSAAAEPNIGSVTIEGDAKTTDSALAIAVKNSFVKTVEQKTSPITNDMGISKITLCSVSCTQYSGYVICASSQDEFHTPYMEKMTGILQSELKDLGQIILAPLRIFEVEIPPTQFIQWIREKADFHVMSHLTEIALAFFSAHNLPLVDQNAESFGVSVVKDLEPEKNLDFDLYLHMPKNKKFLHYLKKGQNYSKAMSNKFVAHAIETLYVRRDQQDDFFKYLARNFIHDSLKK